MSKPTANLDDMLGILNVVEPSPAPYVVSNTENNSEYSVLLISCPLHINQLSGIVSLYHSTTEPIGNVSDTVPPPLPPVALNVPSDVMVKFAPIFTKPKVVVEAI